MSEPRLEELLAAAKSGDTQALGQLIQRHRYGVYRYGLQVCRTTEDAEDAVQETLWAVTRAIKTFRGSASSIVSWMFTIVRRECFRLLERHRRSPIHLGGGDDNVMEGRSGAEDDLIGQKRASLLAEALQALEPMEREVVLLRDIQELSAPEAAMRLNISVGALKSRLHRARVKLRDYVLTREGDK